MTESNTNKNSPSKIYKINYNFMFAEDTINISLNLRTDTMDLIPIPIEDDLPRWTELDHCQCTHCPLSKEDNKHCPVAKNLFSVLEHFNPYHSFR